MLQNYEKQMIFANIDIPIYSFYAKLSLSATTKNATHPSFPGKTCLPILSFIYPLIIKQQTITLKDTYQNHEGKRQL